MNIDPIAGTFTINEQIDPNMSVKVRWGLMKDDVSPQDIFRMTNEGPSARAIIAKYCIRDCALLIRLIRKLDTIPNNFGMSNVCLVPFSYIFMRGQGIKIFSLIINECSKNGYKVPVLDKIYKDDIDIQDNDDNTNTNTNIKSVNGSNQINQGNNKSQTTIYCH